MSKHSGTILMVDDEVALLDLSRDILTREGHVVKTCARPREALRLLEKAEYDVVLLDLKLPEMSGLQFLEVSKPIRGRAEVVVLTGYATIENAVQAMKAGAYGYLSKPFNAEEVLAQIDKILVLQQLRAENQALRQRQGSGLGRMIGQHPRMRQLFRLIEEVAPTPVPVLIQGESGTGKELVARAVHDLSPRTDHPFVVCNGALLAPGVLESELFGHVKGAFTNALQDRKGRIAEADGGTLFLDEIGDLSLEVQVHLLRVLQEGTFEPVGSNQMQQVEVRFVAATHRHLEQEVEEGRFREDLFFRINAFVLHVPPLRGRNSDLPLLCNHFIRQHNATLGKEVKGISAGVMERLERHAWPGNVRELENVLLRAMVLVKGEEIRAEDISFSKGGTTAEQVLAAERGYEIDACLFHPARAAFEEEFLRRALEKSQGNISQAAASIKLNRRNLHRKIEEYRIDLRQLRRKGNATDQRR